MGGFFFSYVGIYGQYLQSHDGFSMAENAYFSMGVLAYPIAAYMSQLEEWISYSWQHMKESGGD